MGSINQSQNNIAFNMPNWAFDRKIKEVIFIDTNFDTLKDYKIKFKKHASKFTISDINIKIRNLRNNTSSNSQKIDIKFGSDSNSYFANVYFDPDGSGTKNGWIIESPTLINNTINPKMYNTRNVYFTAEPDEVIGLSGATPSCITCFPGIDDAAQSIMKKLPADKDDALLALKLQLTQFKRPLELFIFEAHGYDNLLQYEGTDGKKHTLPANEVLNVIAPFMEKKGVILFAACEVAKGNVFLDAAKFLTDPSNHDGRYAGLKIFVSKSGFGAPSTPVEHENLISTYVVINNKNSAFSGLLRVTGGFAQILEMESVMELSGGSSVGKYTSHTLGVNYSALK